MARAFLDQWGLSGAAIYKGALTVGIIGIIEWATRLDAAAARRLANYSLVLGGYPVLVGLALLAIHGQLHAI